MKNRQILVYYPIIFIVTIICTRILINNIMQYLDIVKV
jgi:hypothetical protein